MPEIKAAATTSDAREDHGLQMRVVRALVLAKEPAFLPLRIEAAQGVVTLRGYVTRRSEKEAAVQIVQHVVGVRKIICNIGISAPPPPPRKLFGHTNEILGPAIVVTIVMLLSMTIITWSFGLLANISFGSGDQLPVVGVRGTLVFDAAPAAGARLTFFPVGESAEERPRAVAIVGNDGIFAPSTYGSGDGLVAGNYIVTVTWYKPIVKNDITTPGPDVSPERFRQPTTSPLRVCVADDMSVLPRLQIAAKPDPNKGVF